MGDKGNLNTCKNTWKKLKKKKKKTVPKVSHWILLLRVFEVRSVAAQRSIFLNFLKEKYQTRAVFSAKLPSLFGVKNKQTKKKNTTLSHTVLLTVSGCDVCPDLHAPSVLLWLLDDTALVQDL